MEDFLLAVPITKGKTVDLYTIHIFHSSILVPAPLRGLSESFAPAMEAAAHHSGATGPQAQSISRKAATRVLSCPISLFE